ncbi:hypothetical protein ACH40D_40570 [Streptomyces olivaceoviridis]|uniref:Uncharacterized protein n=1 Tax=Streptomyces olivaceoviridis TaxID=1921 RepID=A0ABW7VJF8_STROI|nr:hypothetical protein [Streptomyces corchorusii]
MNEDAQRSKGLGPLSAGGRVDEITDKRRHTARRELFDGGQQGVGGQGGMGMSGSPGCGCACSAVTVVLPVRWWALAAVQTVLAPRQIDGRINARARA